MPKEEDYENDSMIVSYEKSLESIKVRWVNGDSTGTQGGGEAVLTFVLKICESRAWFDEKPPGNKNDFNLKDEPF